jgi:hypothetical protein
MSMSVAQCDEPGAPAAKRLHLQIRSPHKRLQTETSLVGYVRRRGQMDANQLVAVVADRD